MANTQNVALRVLTNHGVEVEQISTDLVSLFLRLKQMHLQEWRLDGQALVTWMNAEAEDMAKVERDVAITKVTGGSAAIAGGMLTGVGLVGSFFTLGLAAPLVVAGVVLGGAGAVTSAGGDIAKLSILHMKTCEVKGRCESFAQRTKGVLSSLLEMQRLMSKLSDLWHKNNSSNVDINGIEILLRSGKGAAILVNSGIDVCRIAMVIYNISQLPKSGVIFGVDFGGGSHTGSGLSISRSMFESAGVALNIGFGIWDVVDAAGTLQKGGSHASLIRNNASQIKNTIKEIDSALCLLDL